MKITVKGKEYKFDKITRVKNKIYTDAFNKINEKAEKGIANDDEDIDLINATLVKLYDNQFTCEDLDEDMDIVDLTYAFMEVQIDIQSRLNKKIENAKKSFTKGKKYLN